MWKALAEMQSQNQLLLRNGGYLSNTFLKVISIVVQTSIQPKCCFQLLLSRLKLLITLLKMTAFQYVMFFFNSCIIFIHSRMPLNFPRNS